MLLYFPFSMNSHQSHQNSSYEKLHHFTWFYWQTDYKIFEKKDHFINAGFRTGHEGFLYKEFNGARYYIFLGLPVRYHYKINHSWIFMNELVFILPLYQNHTENTLQYENTIEIQYDPYHNIINPDPDSALYSLGVTIKKTSIKNDTENISETMLDLFLKIMILY